MKLKRYKYVGPVDSGATLEVDGEKIDVMLFRGHEVELPEGHEYTERLLAQKVLEEPPEKQTAAERAPKELKTPARTAKPVAASDIDPEKEKGAE